MTTQRMPQSGLSPAETEIVKDLAAAQRYDHSVSVPQLGSLFHFDPNTVLGADLQSVADAYRARAAWVSTNGTTTLNVLALLSVANPGDEVLVQRDCHKSVYAALIHGDLRPVYVEPTYAPDLGTNVAVTPEQLARALAAHPNVVAAHLTSPNYFGIVGDTAGCIEVAHARGVRVIVDEAHGSHLAFHPWLPQPAEHAGADIITQSTHKTCGALSQGSVILFNDIDILPRFYEMVNHLGFVSTSFSYLLLLSVMMGVRQLVEQGHELLEEAMALADILRTNVGCIPGLRTFGTEARRPGFVALDPLRLTVDVTGAGWDGFAFEEAMIARMGIYPEMATLTNVLFLLTLADTAAYTARLLEALEEIAESAPPRPIAPQPPVLPPLPRQVLTPREAFWSHGRRRRRPLAEAIGRVSAETIACYPPGSAVIVAGEEVSEPVVDYLRALYAAGGVLKGASDERFENIETIEV